MSATCTEPYNPPALLHFPVENGEMRIGGIPLRRLAARVGQTPFYAYDRALITKRVEDLRAILPDEIKLNYAVKANPMPAVVQHLSALVDGLDVASAGELQVALNCGAQSRNISFAGPGKRVEELRQAVAAGILINIESFREVAELARIGKELGWPPRVAVRVNPNFDVKSSGMKMGGGPKPFGVDSERVPELLAEIASAGLEFSGFHFFYGSQILRAESIVEAQQKCFELAVHLARFAPAPITHLNLGGGFGIPYFTGERSLDLAPVAANLARIGEQARITFPEAELILELGRYLVGEAGVYVCRLIDRKQSRGQTFYVADGGMHHHLAASGNFGQVIRKNYPVAIGTRMQAPSGPLASIVGPLCTPLDILLSNAPLPDAQPGDLVVVFQSGAYGATASPQAFLGHPPPQEVLV